MGKIEIVDNLLNDGKMVDAIYDHLMYGNLHKLAEKSTVDNDITDLEHIFYASEFSFDLPWVYSLYMTICNAVNLNPSDYTPYRINSNIQYCGMGKKSKYHTDPCDYTFVYFVSPNVEGGEFVYLNSNHKVEYVEYLQDRVVVFESQKLLHKALPPSNLSARVSLAFKMTREELT